MQTTRAQPIRAADSYSSAILVSPRAVPGACSASPRSPAVATTRTTRWPSEASMAMVPAVSRASSSGWAWKKTAVRDTLPAYLPGMQTRALMRRSRLGRVRILQVSDCYLPRLGGIEVQVADLVRMQREAGHEVEVATATRGEPLPGVHRVVARMPFDLPVHPFG